MWVSSGGGGAGGVSMLGVLTLQVNDHTVVRSCSPRARVNDRQLLLLSDSFSSVDGQVRPEGGAHPVQLLQRRVRRPPARRAARAPNASGACTGARRARSRHAAARAVAAAVAPARPLRAGAARRGAV